MLFHHRVQHPVGQGFFHSGRLKDDDGLLYHYVYDCGAMTSYASRRSSRVAAYIKMVGVKSTLHTLFLSHVHADHVNGLEQLLDKETGLAVDTIVLPLVNDIDRLIAYARTAVEDGASAQSEFYRDFILDPTAALSRFNPSQIFFVEPGDGEGGAPGGGELPLRPVDGSRDTIDRDSGDQPIINQLVGSGQPSWGDARVRSAGSISPDRLAVIPDTLGLRTANGHHEWLLAPYVDPTIKAQRDKFLNALAAVKKMKRQELEVWLRDTSHLKDLTTTDLAGLKAAYAALAKNLNLTSMCLYSGPPKTPVQGCHVAVGWRRHRSHAIPPSGRTAWLATGDADLKNGQKRAELLKHYRALINQVSTLTLPHHGSDHNFHADLPSAIKPSLCVASADAHSTWKHPGSKTVQGVYSCGSHLHVVTSRRRSQLSESVVLLA